VPAGPRGHDLFDDDDAGRLNVHHQGPNFGHHLYGNGEQLEDVVTSEVIAWDIESSP
jgi:hypothetical protein